MKNKSIFIELKDKFRGIFTVSFIDAIYKSFLYKDLLRTLFPSVLKRYIKDTRTKQERYIEKMKQQGKIRVAFFIQTPSIWKYDTLFRLMQQSPKFEPIIVIVPYNVHLNYSKEECFNVMKKTEEFVEEKNYEYISSYDKDKKCWRNIKKEINPNIIFFTKPYKDTLPAYYIYNFRERLTCYIPYSTLIIGGSYRFTVNLPLHNLVSHLFVETDFHKKISEEYSEVKGENISVIGSIGQESIIDPTYLPVDPWKPQSQRKKRIIWAPHHTVDYLFNCSNFLRYCDFMIEIAKRYEDRIQMAFKPHPVLKFRLINIWGKEKTDEYYEQWERLPNTQIEEGYYNDLFSTSDSMIHDSISFTFEYLHTLKPVLYTVRDERVKEQWNPLGTEVFNLHYHGYSESDIENFIENVIFKENDPMAEDRKRFYDKFLYPKDNIMPSKKIMQILEEELDHSDSI